MAKQITKNRSKSQGAPIGLPSQTKNPMQQLKQGKPASVVDMQVGTMARKTLGKRGGRGR